MAGITLEIATARLTLYLDAEAKILAGQSVEFNGKRLTMADLGMVQQGIATWNQRTQSLSATSGGMRVRQVIPL